MKNYTIYFDKDNNLYYIDNAPVGCIDITNEVVDSYMKSRHECSEEKPTYNHLSQEEQVNHRVRNELDIDYAIYHMASHYPHAKLITNDLILFSVYEKYNNLR